MTTKRPIRRYGLLLQSVSNSLGEPELLCTVAVREPEYSYPRGPEYPIERRWVYDSDTVVTPRQHRGKPYYDLGFRAWFYRRYDNTVTLLNHWPGFAGNNNGYAQADELASRAAFLKALYKRLPEPHDLFGPQATVDHLWALVEALGFEFIALPDRVEPRRDTQWAYISDRGDARLYEWLKERFSDADNRLKRYPKEESASA